MTLTNNILNRQKVKSSKSGLFESFYATSKKHEDYWRRQLKNVEASLTLPFYTPKNSKTNTKKSDYVEITHNNFYTDSCTKLVLLTSILVYFYRLNNYASYTIVYSNDYLNNIPLKLKSNFSEYVPLTIDLNPNCSFTAAVTKITKQILELQNNKIYTKDLAEPFAASLSICMVKSLDNYNPLSPTDITIVITDGLELYIYGDKKILTKNELFKKTIKNIIPYLKNILWSVSADKNQLIYKIPLLTSEEYKQIVFDWNATEVPYPLHKTLPELFEEQVRKTPNDIAVVFQDEKLTYKELNKKANQAAHYLRTLNVKSNTLVALCVERGLDMVIGMLGILKAGGAYVPLDPTYPENRLRFMLEDSQAQIILTQKSLLKQLPFLNHNKKQIICLNDKLSGVKQYSTDNPLITNDSDSLAYVIYTSGSTGAPKGTMIKHSSVINIVCFSMQKIFYLKNKSRVAQFTSMCFDVSIPEIWSTLLHGSAMYIVPENVRKNPAAFYQFIEQNSINILSIPPAVLKNFPLLPVKSLKTIIVAGEACDLNLARFWSKYVRFVNAYGPTETTVFSTMTICTAKQKIMTIGKPCSNTKIYILDKYLQPIPTNTIGELYIGGNGVSNGYFNRPKLTKEKFVQNPFSGKKNDLLYKTGDLARWLPSGNIDFIGRTDSQIKIRGFRVELGEINSWLQKYPPIKQSAVLVKKNDANNTTIVAYLSCNNKNDFSIDKCKEYLKKILPDYMIPAIFIMLDSLPLNPSGKIDNAALLALKNIQTTRTVPYIPASTTNEKKLIEIWSEVLCLKSEQIGIGDIFFDIGGDSLVAAQIILKINYFFKTSLGVEDLFRCPTIKLLLKKLNSSKQNKEKRYAFCPIKSVPVQQDYPLSYPQKLIWWHQQTAPNMPFYNEPIVININDALNIKALEKSINEIIRRHEILRTNIITKGNEPRQIVQTFQPINIPYFDLRSMNKNNRIKHSIGIGTKHLKEVFDLERNLLIRFTLVRLTNKYYQLFIAVHHTIFDGITIFDIFIKELELLYKNFSLDKPSSLPTPKLQYKDYSVWQQNLDLTQIIKKSIPYWKNQLSNLQHLQLPTKQPRSKYASFRGKRQCLALSKKLTQQLETISTQEGVTLFMTLLTSLNILLFHYTDQEDISIGTAISGRNSVFIEKMMGNFLNTVILRNKVSGDITFKQLLQEIKNTTIDAYSHQDLPFQELLKNINLPRINGSNLPFQVALIFEPNIETSNPTWSISQLETHPGTSKFELMFELDKRPQGIIGRVEYNTDLYDDRFIKNMINHFQTILQNIVTNIHIPINKFSVLSSKEFNKILVNWNKTKQPRTTETICDLFEKQVKESSNKTAVSLANQKLTYNELNQKANKLASYLKKLNTQPSLLIAVCLDRSIEIIICIIGILKAGAAYLPIDPKYPIARIKNILEDSNVPILLTSKSIYTDLQLNKITNKINTIFLDNDWQKIKQESANNIPSCIAQDDLSYVIYTSGSTGKPKGILQTHRTITNLIKWQATDDSSHKKLNITQFASFGFDVSLQETFYALLNGHVLYIISHEVKKSISKLIEFLCKNKINKLFIPPSMLGLLANEALHFNIRLPHLYEIIVAGEALIINNEIRQFFINNKQMRLINHYGPSETHVVTAFNLPKDPEQWGSLPFIGKPIANTKVYILNKHLQPVPVGIIGELYFCGHGLARSYLNQPNLNEEKFIQNPFNKNKGEKLYKTGDLAKWLPNGNITFVDRVDNQVKIRGFRVEIDEIEHCILQHKSVNQCAIKAETDQYNTKRLIAYIVYKGNKIDSNLLKQYLKEKLPEYMIPSIFIILDQLPLNSNGKVDTDALPKPTLGSNEIILTQNLPRTTEEKKLAEIWANILKIDLSKISATDNFFELGGHSLVSLQLLTEIKKTFDVVLEPHELFNAPTITEINLIIQKKKKKHTNNQPSDQLPHVILLKKGKDSSIPIFLIHPIGGTVFWYKNLSLHLNCDNPIYGIQDPCINTKNKLFNSLEEMAKFYLDSIKQTQPKGPYLIGGASFGGTVAIEIAKQLNVAGEAVKHVMLFDSWAIYPDDVQKRKIFEDGIRKMHAVLIKKSATKGLLNINSWLELQWHRAQLLWNYQIPSISHNIILFKAKNPESYFMLQNNSSNYWQNYATAKVNTHLISGNHETIFQSPNVEILSNKFDEVITTIIKNEG